MYLIGNVLKAQGIKGEIKVEPLSPRPERFKVLKKVHVKKDTIQIYSIENVRLTERFVFIKFFEINTRTAADALRGAEILVEHDDLIDLEMNEYFVHDLIGCQVLNEEGTYLGDLVDVLQLSSNDVYVLKTRNGREILIPAIKDVIKKVMPESRQIIIHLLEGLMD